MAREKFCDLKAVFSLSVKVSRGVWAYVPSFFCVFDHLCSLWWRLNVRWRRYSFGWSCSQELMHIV